MVFFNAAVAKVDDAWRLLDKCLIKRGQPKATLEAARNFRSVFIKKCDDIANTANFDDCLRAGSFEWRLKNSLPLTKTDAYKGPTIHHQAGEILKRQKPATIKIQSTPTQQYIDDMLGIAKTERASQVTKDGVGYVNRGAAIDAHYAFTKGTKIEPVVTTSVPTQKAIDDMFNMKLADDILARETLGMPMPQAVIDRRAQAYEAFTGQNALADLISGHFNQLKTVAANYIKS